MAADRNSVRGAVGRVIVCMALGIVTTVSVAWLCASLVKVEKETDYPAWTNEYGNLTFGGFHARGFGAVRVRWGLTAFMFNGPAFEPGGHGKFLRGIGEEILPQFHADGRFPHWWGAVPSLLRDVPSDEPPTVIQDARGWPVVALWCEWHEGLTFASLSNAKGGIDLPIQAKDYYELNVGALPLRPVWRGLFINTAVFGSVWYALIFGAVWVRRRWRLAAGACMRCGYDLTGLTHDVCPECGERVESGRDFSVETRAERE